MHARQRILLKLTGQIFAHKTTGPFEPNLANSIVRQIKELSSTYQFGIVIGGGNIFRGSQQGKQLGLSPWAAHTCGMVATLVNGIALRDLLAQQGVPTTLVSALEIPEVAQSISQQIVDQSMQNGNCIIFAGGTGNPYFTTDTNAILRALQIGTTQVWKGTSVSGIYDQDPIHNKQAQLLKTVTYTQALENRFGIMDSTAYTLAQEHRLTIRVFDIFAPNALVTAANDRQFGTIIQQ
jgi:uridylate kinase